MQPDKLPLPATGSSLGIITNRYQLVQSLGRGSFGQVFLAEDLEFDPPRRVAMKILHPEFLADPGLREDIKREAGVLARFNHPNILRVIEFKVTPDLAYIVTDLAEGGSLAARLRPDPSKPPVRLPFEVVLHYLEQLSDALDEAHAQGLIHRDIKPLNILLDRRGHPLIADFGLATALSHSQSSVLVEANTSGTPPYMAPEQWLGQAGKASDIYSLAIMVYQMVTGQLPFQGGQFELMGQHLNAPVPPLSYRAPDLQYPGEWDEVIARVLAKDPKQRTRPATEFYRRFDKALKDHSKPVTVKGEAISPDVPLNPLPEILTQPQPQRQPVSRPETQPPTQPLSDSQTQVVPPSPQPLAETVVASLRASNTLPQTGQNQADQARTQLAATQIAKFQSPALPPKEPSSKLFVPVRPKYKVLLWGGLSGTLLILIVIGLLIFLAVKNPVSTTPTTFATAKMPVASIAVRTQSIPTSISPSILTVTPTLQPSTAAMTALSSQPSIREIFSLNGHTDAVNSVRFSPDGKTLASASSDNSIKLWDVTTGKEIKTLTGHTSKVYSVAFSPDGKKLASGSADKTIKLWDVATGNLLTSLSGSNGPIWTVVFSPDGRTLVSGGDDAVIRIWSIPNNNLIKTLYGHTSQVIAVAFSPDGKILASGGADKTVKLWDVATGKVLNTLMGHSSFVLTVAFSPDGKILASGGADKTVKLWDVAGGRLITTLAGHTNYVHALVFTYNNTLFSGGEDQTINVWNLSNFQLSDSIYAHSSSVNALSLSPDGKKLASGSGGDTIKLWDVISGNKG